MCTNLLSDVDRPTVRDSPKAPSGFGWFALAHLLAAVIWFPMATMVAAVVFSTIENGFEFAIAKMVLLHLFAFFVGLKIYRELIRYFVPFIVVLASFLLVNGHYQGAEDNSPFSNGIGTVDQQLWGLAAYYTVFDDPNAGFGISYFDWGGFFLNVELAIGFTAGLACVICMLATIIGRLSLRRSGGYEELIETN